MDKKSELIFIAKNSGEYLQVTGKTLDKRLESINLDEKHEEEIMKEHSFKVIRDKGLSLFGAVGDVISTVLTWNEEVNQNITEAKQLILLEQYFNKVDEQAKGVKMLSELLKNPQGNTLFNKILRIIDDSPPDPELTEHLSTVLKKIIEEGNFEELFERHRYALGQIERLTPQAITIIADYQNWPSIQLGTSISFGPKIKSDFYTEFTQAYSQLKHITDINKLKRIQHSVVEIQNIGLMEAYNAADGKTLCQLTDVGRDLLVYIE
ncbi:hypothetical protein [Paenisporosarcina antarctica]|uniref:Uncharacterized protein n=1 Tax=Paenisporosarcina antarctica TaxID=417367 RepID=A0A4P7A288_9BACL|nr:hypothetical protein [Paenisporosarcina antarctica]QBP43170.1 hypothetical protein E2636_18600 [Paenisporosarcina antarctica]